MFPISKKSVDTFEDKLTHGTVQHSITNIEAKPMFSVKVSMQLVQNYDKLAAKWED